MPLRDKQLIISKDGELVKSQIFSHGVLYKSTSFIIFELLVSHLVKKGLYTKVGRIVSIHNDKYR